MAKFDTAKTVNRESLNKDAICENGLVIEPTNVMTGDKHYNRFLYYQLKMSMLKAKKIDIIVSFLMESGVRMLLNDLKSAIDRGASVRVLTGNYLGITQPSALYLIKKELTTGLAIIHKLLATIW